jgi:hypothetical protein
VTSSRSSGSCLVSSSSDHFEALRLSGCSPISGNRQATTKGSEGGLLVLVTVNTIWFPGQLKITLHGIGDSGRPTKRSASASSLPLFYLLEEGSVSRFIKLTEPLRNPEGYQRGNGTDVK